MQESLKRAFDIIASLGGIVVFAIPMLIIYIAVRTTSGAPVLHWSQRVGRHSELFWMPKFRSMRNDTPDIATHLLQDPSQWITPVGRLLRTTSLDELPQLWSVFVGDMSIVGPRPALFNQEDLITLRKARGVDILRPGITGWAQVNGRDELPIPKKVDLDAEYLANYGIIRDVEIILKTIGKVLIRDGVKH